tara:strand:- start:973 stop:1101 length:129 start_codon:yes stop_codon:yes gene_type:complete
MTNLTDIQKELDRLNDEYITLLKDRIKELEETNETLLLILNK